MLQDLLRELFDTKPKPGRQRQGAFRFEHLEARHVFSTTPVTPTDPLESTPPSDPSQEPLAADPAPLDSHWAPIVYAGADFTIAAGVPVQLNAELIATGPINMTLLWSKVSGPGQASFGNSTALNSTVQFDTAGTYVLDLTVTTDYATKSDQVTVSVLAGNHSPVFTSPSSANVAENSTAVMTVTATDSDLPVQSLSYSIVGGADQAKFSITSGGALTFKTAPNYEAPADADLNNVYVVTVQVSDGVGGTASQTINVSVTPTNDNNPVFTSSNSANVAENTTAVMTVTATDADAPAQSLSYSIAGGADAAKFSITSGGVLTFKSAPNYEAPTDANGDNIYVVTVQVSDGVGGTATQTINVSVTPVNDNTPVFTSATSVDVADGITAVMTVTATDADAPAQTLSYSIVGGADQAKFSITAGGVLTFQSAPSYASPTDANGDSIYEVTVQVSDGAGRTAAQTVAVRVTASNIINIDQAWLNAQGSGPYYLNQQGKTYRLQTDVTTTGTAFAITAQNVTFDLNGHTITYDNATPITIPNGSFETGTGAAATGWDFSGAPGASRYAGTWLYNETYDGSYSLKFSDPTATQYITSTTTITLEANTTYSLSAMFEYGGQGDTVNPGVKGYVRLVGDGLPTREVSWNQTNWRGIQLQEGIFTTGGSPETYYVHVGIEAPTLTAWAPGQSVSNNGTSFCENDGKYYLSLTTGVTGSTPPTHTSGDASDGAVTWRNVVKPFYIDDIKIQRTGTYGVAVGTYVGAGAVEGRFPGITQSGNGSNATILNGTIVQGAEGATWGHGIHLEANYGYSATISGLDITVHGANSSPLYQRQGDASATVFNNTLTSNVSTITSRDSGHGAVINGVAGRIYNNTITNGPHMGIRAGTTSASEIYDNTIQLKAKYTNAFAIAASYGSQVYRNNILCGTGDYAARGIIAWANDSNPTPTRIYDNVIRVNEKAGNQEYQGAAGFGAYGIQLEGATNTEVYGNDVIAYAIEDRAYALRIGGSTTAATGLQVHDNSFEAVSMNGKRAAVLKFSSVDSNDLIFEDNALITNDSIFDNYDHAVYDDVRSTITVANPVPTSALFTVLDYGELHTSVNFIDPTYADAGTRTLIEAATVLAFHLPSQPSTRGAFQVSWTTTIHVTDGVGAPLANATVTIKDKNNNQVFSGTTDANGQVVAVLKEFQTQGGTKTSYNPYTATATIGGQPVPLQFTADKVQTVTVQPPAAPGAGSSSSATPISGQQNLVAAMPTAVLNGSELRVTGTDGDDSIRFYQSGKYIYLQGSAEYWKASKVKSIVVYAGDGENLVSFDSYANGGSKKLKEVATVVGGAGTTRVISGTAEDISFSGQGGFASVSKKGEIALYGNAVAAQPEAPLAAGPTAVLTGGQLRITGTDDDDIIKFYQSGKNIYIQGVTGYWSASKVKSIYVDAKGGDDYVSFNSYANGGNKALKETATVVGSTGTERVSVGAAHDVYFSGQGRYATVDKKGGAALDGVALNLQSYATGSLKKGVLTITGTNGNDNLNFAQINGQIYVSGVFGSFKAKKVKSIVVRLQDGSDSVSLRSLANGGLESLAVPATIYSGAGTQSVRLANGHDVDISGAGHTLYVAANGTAYLDGHQVDPAPVNWFDANIQDAALRTLGHNLYLDSLIDRTDILALFADSKDGGVVDATELADLQKIAANVALFGTNDYIRSLTGYIANGSAANAQYQGQALGNLTAGSASTQLDKLVNKWFFGLDRPTAGGTYQPMSGSLFASGPSYADIRQGTVGDNYFLTSLAETAFRSSSTITSMFIVNGDGTYGVRFYDPQGHAQYVTVDSYLPTDANGKLMYASRGQTYNNSSNELWVALAEKAYAQLNEFGWSRAGFASSGQNSYAALDGGYIHQALGQLSYSATTAYADTNGSTSFSDFVAAYNAGKRIGFASLTTPAALSGVVGSQAYAVVGYNGAAQTVTLFNPWGTEFGLKTMNWSQIQQNFEYFDRTA